NRYRARGSSDRVEQTRCPSTDDAWASAGRIATAEAPPQPFRIREQTDEAHASSPDDGRRGVRAGGELRLGANHLDHRGGGGRQSAGGAGSGAAGSNGATA